MPTMKCPAVLLTLSFAVAVSGQEPIWIANRASNDVMQIAPWGAVLQRVATPGNPRSAHLAPDGKVWIVGFAQTTFHIFDPADRSLSPVAFAAGSPYAIAFDANGHAWVSGGAGVQHFTPAGATVAWTPLPLGNAQGITIDSAGNKWIAQRAVPAAVSRISSAGAVQRFVLTGVAPTLLPTAVAADGQGSVWLVGDGASQLVGIDAGGNVHQIHTVPASGLGSVVCDDLGNVWVGSYSSGDLVRYPGASVFSLPPNILGLAVDTKGRVWATARVSLTGPGPACEVRRVDPSTSSHVAATPLQYGAFSGYGTMSAATTSFHHSSVVAPQADTDGDGETNAVELANGTLPMDRWSDSTFHHQAGWLTQIGAITYLGVDTVPGALWMLGLSFGLVPAGSGITLPGFAHEMRLDPGLDVGVAFLGVGQASIVVSIPSDPSLRGLQWFSQGLVITPTTSRFGNVAGFWIW
jgi:hypothetical protein